MFGKKNNQPTIQEVVAATPGPNVSSFHIHTIPSKFLPKEVLESSPRVKRVFFWIGGIIVISGLLFFASMLLMKSVRTNETVRVENSVGTPTPVQNVNVQMSPSQIIEHDLGACSFSRSTAGYDQELQVGEFPVKGYTASYFCQNGSLSVQIFKFQNEQFLEKRVEELESTYRVFRDTLVQDVNDEQKILWGSGVFLIQVTANSLTLESVNVSVLLDEYLRLYPALPNLPWKFVSVVMLATPAERDAKRVSDVKKIQIALEFYKVDKGVYPEALDQTRDLDLKQYLAEIPLNPATDPSVNSAPESPYEYTQKLGGQSYEISFELEEGSGGIPAGEIIARPQGMYPKSREVSSLFPSSVDTDTDGLTDAEEKLWGTDQTRLDSDEDSYGDGKEVRDGYDPGKVGDARLESSPSAKNYLSSLSRFSATYPAAWTLEEGDDRVEFFSEDKKDFFSVLVEDASAVNSISDWYEREFPSHEDDPKPAALSGSEGAVESPDGLSVYALFSGKLYTISYSPGIKETLDYQTTFQMFLKSLKFFENPNP